MGSSLIYVAIVAMWAGLLIPMWLRRHESETEVRSVDRFSTAMRILSRRTPPPADRRYLVMPQRPPAATLPIADVPRAAARPAARPPRAPSRTAHPAASGARAAGAQRSSVVARRRQVLLGLLGLAGLLFVLAVAGVVSWWWQLVGDLALAGFVWHLRAEAKRTAAIARRRRQLRERRTTAPVAPARPAVPVQERAVPTAAPAAAAVAVPAAGPLVVDERTWEPVPVPLPTYVTAPVAERPEPPMIDLTRPGRWSEQTSREPLFDQEAFADDFADDMDDDGELVEIVERRRAVND